MENIVLQPVQQEYVEFMALPMGVYKNIQYYNGIQNRSFSESHLCKKEGAMYYTYEIFKVKKSKNGYYRHKTQKYGFTLDEKNKLNIWYGKNIFEIPGISNLFSHLNMNWLDESMMIYITKGIAEKILTGKITNNIDLAKAYIKVMRLQCSPKLFFDVIKTKSLNKSYLLQMMTVAKDQNHLLQRCLNEYNSNHPTDSYVLSDLIKQAHILGRQIDYTWSSNRMKEEHQKWTKEIMDAEIADMKDVTAIPVLPFLEFKRDGFKLLTTKKEVYTEGKEMGHCVYTNYWSSVVSGNYLVYQVNLFGERATLGLNVYDNEIIYNQCYREYNKPVSTALKEQVHMLLDSLNTWYKENKIIKQQISF